MWLIYVEQLLILTSTVIGYVSNIDFDSLIGICTGIASSTVIIKICVRITGIKKYMLIIKKKKTKIWKNRIVSKN